MQPSPTGFEKLSRQLYSAYGKIKWYLVILDRHQLAEFSLLAEGKSKSCYPVCWTKDMDQAIKCMGLSLGRTKMLVHYLKFESIHLFTQAADLTWYQKIIFAVLFWINIY